MKIFTSCMLAVIASLTFSSVPDIFISNDSRHFITTNKINVHGIENTKTVYQIGLQQKIDESKIKLK